MDHRTGCSEHRVKHAFELWPRATKAPILPL
jgi:hypothetical protein